MLELLPAKDRGIFVITLLLSTVTVYPDAAGTDPVVVGEGTVKFFGSQSSIKKPIVAAKAGSTWGFTVVVSTGLGGLSPLLPFLQEENVWVNKTIIAPTAILHFIRIIIYCLFQ
jgi:hypothetical protein